LPQYRRDQLEQYIQPITDVLRAIGASPDTPDQEPEPPQLRKRNATIGDLLNANLLLVGARLRPISSQHETVARVTREGQLEVGGKQYDSPSGAAVAVVGHEMNGWTFWGAPSGEGTLVPLARLRARLEPKTSVANDRESAPPKALEKAKAPGGLKFLLDAGLLEPGAELWATSHGQRHEATVDDDGSLHLGDGSIYRNPSGAAVAITGHETNGWMFWRVRLGSQSLRLKELREMEKGQP
jgi:Restriction Enzyme Adenine Methylase Associated